MRQCQCDCPPDLDGAGWHSSSKIVVPDNIVLLPLPPYAPELNSTENIWEYLRDNLLSNTVWETYEAIVDACCNAWNALIAKPEVITSIGSRDWAQVKIYGGWYYCADRLIRPTTDRPARSPNIGADNAGMVTAARI